ncbi:hypothetical protein BU15DRAFT_77852 [Melanogaster broomeanus]|nr:hypothetical protein BU15DRAFT_77852 [Melanogaster broomeanus]
MSYPPLVRQEGFQLPSPAHTASPEDTSPTSPPPDSSPDSLASTASNNLFMPHNISFLPEPFRKFPSAAQAHQHPHPSASTPTIPSSAIDFADELASLIDTHPHSSSHERSTHSHSPGPSYDDTYRHNIFDISAPTSAHHHHHHNHHHPSSSANDIYHSPTDLPVHPHAHFNSTLPSLNSSMRYEPHPDPPSSFTYRHTPSPTQRSRSRSRPPSLGPTRTTRRDRRTDSISSHVSSTSPPPRPHPHAIVIPGRGTANSMGGFFVPGGAGAGACAPAEYSLPTPESLSHSFNFGSAQTHGHGHAHSHSHSQYPYPAPSSPYYPYPPINRTGTPSMGISPTEVETLNGLSMNGMNGAGAAMSVPGAVHHHLGAHASSIQPSSLPATASALLSSSFSQVGGGSKSSVSVGSGTKTALDPDTHLSEKRRRRRESHNAVERRRRDNINERIGELAGLIPDVLFDCDAPLVVPASVSGAGPLGGGFAMGDELFSSGLLGDSGMHVLSAEGMDGLPELPEEETGGDLVKKDPSEEREGLHAATNGGGVNGLSEQGTIKANKGMILRKVSFLGVSCAGVWGVCADRLFSLQLQLVSIQIARTCEPRTHDPVRRIHPLPPTARFRAGVEGRDLEERNRVLEREIAVLHGSGEVSPRAKRARTRGSAEREDMEMDNEVQAGEDEDGCDGVERVNGDDRDAERRGRQRARGSVKSDVGGRDARMEMAMREGRVSASRERMHLEGVDMET